MDTYNQQFNLKQDTSAYWHNKSKDLFVSARILWFAMQENKNFDVNCWATYKMLIAMSFELMFKAHCIGNKVEFKQNHNLVELASYANLSISSEEIAVLNILSEYIIWDGRYPIPKKAQHLREHWINEEKVLADEINLGKLKGRKSNGKLDFENLQPIWRRFSDFYLAAYN